MNNLIVFENNGGELKPGQVLEEDPPYCFKESEMGVTLETCDSFERLEKISYLSKTISKFVDGTKIAYL